MDLTKITTINLVIHDINGAKEERYDLFYISIDECIEQYCEKYSINREMIIDYFVLSVVVK